MRYMVLKDIHKDYDSNQYKVSCRLHDLHRYREKCTHRVSGMASCFDRLHKRSGPDRVLPDSVKDLNVFIDSVQ